MAVGEQAEVADAHEASGQDVEQEAPQELLGGERHDLVAVGVPVVSPAEIGPAVSEVDDAIVRDRDADCSSLWSLSGMVLRARTEQVSACACGRDDQSAKFWLEPVGLVVNLGFGATELARIEIFVQEHRRELLEAWMGTSEPGAGERIVDVSIGDVSLTARLADGREISVPLVWYPDLLRAPREQRERW
jgi:hypothetical protein